MVRGLFSDLKFPYAQFPCSSVSGDQLFEPFWEAVRRLEKCGFKVMGLTCDGLSANRKLFRMHMHSEKSSKKSKSHVQPKPTTKSTIEEHKSKLPYKVANRYAEDDRSIYFFSDPPHLLKTVRNCWANKKRKLWVSLHYYNKYKVLYTTCAYSAMGTISGGHILKSYITETDLLDWLL